METWISLIGEFGFPVIVTLYLLYRIEAKLDKLNESILSLPQKMWQMDEVVKRSS